MPGYFDEESDWLEEAAALKAVLEKAGKTVDMNHMFWWVHCWYWRTRWGHSCIQVIWANLSRKYAGGIWVVHYQDLGKL